MIPSPSHIFLIDSLGAVLAAFFPAVILTTFEAYFGMPHHVLYLLAVVASAYALYSGCCHFLLRGNRRPFLKGIVIANIFYGWLIIVAVLRFLPLLTDLALLYFALELLIMGILICLELKVLSRNAVL